MSLPPPVLFMSRPIALVATIALGLSCASSFAQSTRRAPTANSALPDCTLDTRNPVSTISACTARIDSGVDTGDALATDYQRRATAYGITRDYQNAVAGYDKAIATIDDKTSEARKAELYAGRAHALDYAKRHDQAISDWDRVIALQPNNAGAWESKCWSLTLQGTHLDQALQNCDQGNRVQPNNNFDPYNRAVIFLKLGRYVEAIAQYNIVLQRNKDSAEALYGRGLAKTKSGDSAGGRTDMDAATRANPGTVDDFARYGITLASLGDGPVPAVTVATQQDYADCQQNADIARSVAACSRIASDGSLSAADRALAYRWRANDRLASGSLDEAIGDFGEAIKLDPNNVAIYAGRAIAELRKGDRAGAISDYRKAMSLDAAKIGNMAAASAELKEIADAATTSQQPTPQAAQPPPQPVTAANDKFWASLDPNSELTSNVVWGPSEDTARAAAKDACNKISNTCSPRPAATSSLDQVFVTVCCLQPKLGCATSPGDSTEAGRTISMETLSAAHYSVCSVKQSLAARTGRPQ